MMAGTTVARLRRREYRARFARECLQQTTAIWGQERAFAGMGIEKSRNPASRRLDTWKEIATYFERDIRTVRRWEKDRGLPIHRIPGNGGGTVYAYEEELVVWLRRDPKLPAIDDQPAEIKTERRVRAANLISLWPIAAVMLIVGLALTLLLRDGGAPTGVHDRQAEAFYNAGLYEWQTRTPIGLTHAVSDFKRAIAREPNYAEAYAGLANCYNLLREYATMPPQVAYPLAKAAAERAVALRPTLGQAHAALAFDDFYWARDIRGAEHEFRTAIALEPRDAVIHHWYATFLMTIRESSKALDEIGKAEALDSGSRAILADKALILSHDGKADEAINLLQRLEQAEPTFMSPHQYLSSIYLARGDDRDFLRETRAAADARHDPGAEAISAAAASGYRAGGRDAMFKAMLKVEKQLYARRQVSAYGVALAYAGAGDAESALVMLRTSLARREPDNIALAIDPALDALRGRTQFRSLIEMAGLASHGYAL